MSTEPTSSPSSDTEAFIVAQLGAAGISASPPEVTRFAAGYPALRQMADLLHTVAAARYEVPGLHFTPMPEDRPWS